MFLNAILCAHFAWLTRHIFYLSEFRFECPVFGERKHFVSIWLALFFSSLLFRWQNMVIHFHALKIYTRIHLRVHSLNSNRIRKVQIKDSKIMNFMLQLQNRHTITINCVALKWHRELVSLAVCVCFFLNNIFSNVVSKKKIAASQLVWLLVLCY